MFPRACDTDRRPLYSSELTPSNVSGDQACFKTDFPSNFPKKSGAPITLCGRWHVDPDGNTDSDLTCFTGSRRLGPDKSGDWPQSCDAANTALVSSFDTSSPWVKVPKGVKPSPGPKFEHHEPVFSDFTPSEQKAYLRAYHACGEMERAYKYLAIGNYLKERETSKDDIATAEIWGCSDGSAEPPTPLKGSGLP
jgi:hypothetical protein